MRNKDLIEVINGIAALIAANENKMGYNNIRMDLLDELNRKAVEAVANLRVGQRGVNIERKRDE